jgi:hypothetical protein
VSLLSKSISTVDAVFVIPDADADVDANANVDIDAGAIGACCKMGAAGVCIIGTISEGAVVIQADVGRAVVGSIPEGSGSEDDVGMIGDALASQGRAADLSPLVAASNAIAWFPTTVAAFNEGVPDCANGPVMPAVFFNEVVRSSSLLRFG